MKKRKIKFFQQLRYLCVAGVCILGLVTIIASSGGGDEEGGAPVNTNLPLSLTTGNAEGVTGLTLETAEGAITAGSIGTGGVGLSANSPIEDTFNVSALHIAQDAISRVLEISQTTAPAPWGIRAIDWPNNNPEVVPCAGGVGSVSIGFTENVPADGELDQGESAFLDYNRCDALGSGLILNGEVTVGVLDLNGDPPAPPPAAWMVRFRLNFNSLTATDGGSVIGIFGTLDVTVDALASGTVVTTITTEVRPPGGGPPASSVLSFEEGSDFIQLTLFTLVLEETSPGGAFALSTQGTLESSLIGGTVTFLTTALLTGTDFGNNNPTAGQLQITGAANTSILMRVLLAPPNVDLDVDVDGDGNSDVTLNTDWNGLDNAADVL